MFNLKPGHIMNIFVDHLEKGEYYVALLNRMSVGIKEKVRLDHKLIE